MIQSAIHGFILALGLILPLGVQNVFIFNQGVLQRPVVRAMPAVLTASLCDTLLIVLAVTGVSLLVLNVIWFKYILLVGGTLFLVYMGWATWNSTPQAEGGGQQTFTARKQMMFAMSVSLLNPHAILDTIGVIGTSSLQYIGSEKWVFTVSCILVSWLWFISLAMAGRLIGTVDKSGKLLKWLSKVSAIVMWGAAIYLITSLV
ncbi:LysE/ArgO family amino acid transporter [Ammoniphilus sp. CFH 90114]|uniref:LysE/ArgO family amino acid transporter n=1 Tax=Ammoniphilus sp. CFH 90114 TaxID=2493665 RepID=UPI00100F5AA7|nr:LysE/ArgO family amino acid transporter [Ammoniphilus sp. CFH 90114]RXT06520.1 amino acid transporter [Ammoniphilus sp. CFH 90114]